MPRRTGKPGFSPSRRSLLALATLPIFNYTPDSGLTPDIDVMVKRRYWEEPHPVPGLVLSDQNSRAPLGIRMSGANSTTSPSSSGKPRVKTSDMNFPI